MFAAARTSTARIASMGSRTLSRRSPSASKNGGVAAVQKRNMGGGGAIKCVASFRRFDFLAVI
ncbi:hypothetical protein ACHAXS_004060 [Conticribra weissflogii]